MRLPIIAACLASLVCIQFCVVSDSDAQEFLQSIRGKHTDHAYSYSPNDPWQRNKWFNLQTGHYGKFYNCDDEECKRNSPYICWKPRAENDLPPYVGIWGNLKLDVAQVRQRIIDGAGDCLPTDCNCAKCGGSQHVGQPAGCTSCSQTVVSPTGNRSNPVQSRFAPTSIEPVPPRLPFENSTGESGTIRGSKAKFGLIQGRIVAPHTVSPIEATAQETKKEPNARRAAAYLFRQIR